MTVESRTISELRLKEIIPQPTELMIIELAAMSEMMREHFESAHRIDFNELIIFTEGSGELCVDLQYIPYQEKTMFSVSKGQVQLLEGCRNSNGYLILFSDQFFYSNQADYQWMINLKLFNTHDFTPVINLCEEDYNELINYVNLMQVELNKSNFFAKETLLGSMLKVLILKAESLKREQDETLNETGTDYKLFQDFKRQLEKFYKENRSVQFYADLLCLTTRKLNQITHSYWGKSVKEVIEERVILEIKRQLIHTNLTAKEISNSIGFSDPTNFNKFFKKHTQISPAKYRSGCVNT